jgi:uncharacterized membrane protein YdjX (TVP38/TMEM64 family)
MVSHWTIVVFVPPTLLIFGAGYSFCQALDGQIVYGVLAALTSVYFGSIIGAILAFCRARYLSRDLIRLFAQRYPIVRAADKGASRILGQH